MLVLLSYAHAGIAGISWQRVESFAEQRRWRRPRRTPKDQEELENTTGCVEWVD